MCNTKSNQPYTRHAAQWYGQKYCKAHLEGRQPKSIFAISIIKRFSVFLRRVPVLGDI